MPIYHDGKKMKPYRGYRKPVNVYYGDKKVAGWKNSTQTGNNLTFQTTYSDTADVTVKGKTEQKSEWVHKQGSTTQQTYDGVNLLDVVDVTGANGLTAVTNSDKSVTISGTPSTVTNVTYYPQTNASDIGLQVGVNYTLVSNETPAGVTCRVFNVTTSETYPAGTAFTLSGDDVLRIGLNVSTAYDGVEYTNYAMLVESENVLHIYEPYTGGIPAPNPGFPQPLISNLPAGTYKVADYKGDWWEFTLTEDLHGIDDVKDSVEFDKYSHRGYLRKKTTKYVFNGSETFWYYGDTGTINERAYTNIQIALPTSKCFCDKYKWYDTATLWDEETVGVTIDLSGRFRLYLAPNSFENVDDFKIWLASNPLTVVCVAISPTRTSLTFTKNNSSTAPECPMEFLTDTPSGEYPAEVFDASGTVKVANADNTQSQTATIEILRSNADGTVCDEFEVKTGKLTRKIGRIESYNGEDVGDDWISSTGALDTGATVEYVLAEPIEEQYTPVILPTYYPTTVITTTNDTPAELETTTSVKVEDEE
jgi:hypothetical protein